MSSSTPPEERDRAWTRDQSRIVGLRVIQDIDGLTRNHTQHWTEDVSFEQLQRLGIQAWGVHEDLETLEEIEEILILPPTSEMPRKPLDYMHWGIFKLDLDEHELMRWSGSTAPGMIIMRDAYREQHAPTEEIPYISSTSLCIYNHQYGSLDDLKYVFLDNIKNKQTRAIIELIIPDWQKRRVKEIVTFDYGSPEYTEIMGTRLGRLVGYMILGAFPVGTRRIARINVFKPLFGGMGRFMSLRFDIVPISSPSPGDAPTSPSEPAGLEVVHVSLTKPRAPKPSSVDHLSSYGFLLTAPIAEPPAKLSTAPGTPGARVRSAAAAAAAASHRSQRPVESPASKPEPEPESKSLPPFITAGDRPKQTTRRPAALHRVFNPSASSRVLSRTNPAVAVADIAIRAANAANDSANAPDNTPANTSRSTRSPASAALADIAARSRTSRDKSSKSKSNTKPPNPSSRR